MSMRRLLILVVSAGTVTSAGVLLLTGVVGAASDGDRGAYSGSAGPGFANGNVSVLSRAPTSSDRLTTSDLGPAAGLLSNLRAARLARVVGTQQIYVAPGAAGNICLIVRDSADQSTTVDCAERETLASGTIYISTPDPATRTEDIVGVVSDGVRSVEDPSGKSRPVVANVFTATDVHGQLITLTNSSGAQSVVDLGMQFPPGS
jgi:hypothetical protein